MASEREYYVLSDTMANPAGYKIYTDKDGNRRIKMKPKVAQFWIDQGALGTAPKPKPE